jgi:hypothetical protein
MAEPSNLPGVAQSQCRCLRSKEMFIQVEPDAGGFASSSGIFWCTHTQNCLGPDGKVADQESCQPGRTCFEPV